MKLKVKWGSDEEFYFQENLKNKCYGVELELE
jgi:hypothetical protein